MPSPSTHFLPIFDSSSYLSDVDEVSKDGSPADDGHIKIWFLLLQYACTRGEFLPQDYEILRHLHWFSRLGSVHDPKVVASPSNCNVQKFQLQTQVA